MNRLPRPITAFLHRPRACTPAREGSPTHCHPQHGVRNCPLLHGIPSGRHWLMLVLAVAASSGMSAEPPRNPTPRDLTFIATSDLHYDAFENEDRNERVRDTLRYLNGVTNLAWPGELGGGPIASPRGVLVLGDVIDDGDRMFQGKHQTPRQWHQFVADFGFDGTDGLLNFPVFETWGNHDGPPAGQEKVGFSFQARLKERNLRRQQKGWLTGLSTNQLHYSWDWDGVHFVMLGLYPADAQHPQIKYSPVWHDPQGALTFLKHDLAQHVGASGRPVILLSHCGFDTDWWHARDWRAAFEAAKAYNVILYFYGHSGTGLRTWGPSNADQPWQCVNTGQAENGFFVVQITGDRVRLAYRIKRWRNETLADGKTRRAWDGTWEWKHLLDQPLTNPAAARPIEAPRAAGTGPEDFAGLRGANYVPSYARNDVQLWMDYDAAVIDRELGYAETLGLNCVRVFLQFAVYERDPRRFLDHFESFLALCAKHRIQMMPVLFDSCFGEFPDLKNHRDKDWMACPGQNRLGPDHWPKLESYVRDVVGIHRDDRRIVMWDVMNEPTCTRFYKDEADQQRIHTFLDHFLEVVKAQNPRQPRTVGLMFSGEIPLVLGKVDVIGFHNYRRDLREDLRKVKELARTEHKPALINEVVRRPEQPFEWALPILREERVGWVFWELMLGRTEFSRGPNPIQGLIYPDGTCRDAREVAAVMNTSLEEARRRFPERPPPVVEEDGVVYRGFWTRWTGTGPRQDRLFYSVSPSDTATFTFSGTAATLIHKVGPDCGIARVLLDGQPATVAELDTYAPVVEWNRRTVVARDLPAGRHVVVLQPTGRKHAQSSDRYIQIVGFE